MDLICFTTITSTGTSKEIEFPLHPETKSPEMISNIVTELLNTISECVNKLENCKDGDILQALSMVMAIRSRMVNIDPDHSYKLLQELIAMHHQAAVSAKEQIASRA